MRRESAGKLQPDQVKYAILPLDGLSEEIEKLLGHTNYLAEVAVRDLQSSFDACVAEVPDGASHATKLLGTIDAQQKLHDARYGYEFARQQTLVRDLEIFRALRHLDGALTGLARELDNELSLIQAANVTGPVLDVNRSKVAERIERLKPFADAAGEALSAKL